MLKKRLALVMFLFAISQAVYPNFNLLPGYYIDLKGDTIHCQIDYNDRDRNPRTIQIRLNGSMREFGPEEIKGFGVWGYHDYVSATVTYHTNPTSGNEILENFSDSTETKAWFLKVLDSGYYSLYSLVIPSRSYLFTANPDKQVTELVYRVRQVKDSLIEDESYKKYILTLFMNEGLSGKYFNRINSAVYNISSIGSLYRILNESHSGVRIRRKRDSEFQFEVFFGGMMNSFPSTFDSQFTKGNKFKSDFSTSGGINFLFTIPGKFKSFKVGASVGYNGYKGSISQSGSFTHTESAAYYYTTTYTESMALKSSLVLTNIYAMWLMNPLDKMKAYVKAGLNYSFVVTDNQDVTGTFSSSTSGIVNGTKPFQLENSGSGSLVSLESHYLSLLFSAGIITGRSRMEFSYWPVSNIVSSGSDTPPFKFGSMALYYYFSIFPLKRSHY
jgi:hypothetical protein